MFKKILLYWSCFKNSFSYRPHRREKPLKRHLFQKAEPVGQTLPAPCQFGLKNLLCVSLMLSFSVFSKAHTLSNNDILEIDQLLLTAGLDHLESSAVKELAFSIKDGLDKLGVEDIRGVFVLPAKEGSAKGGEKLRVAFLDQKEQCFIYDSAADEVFRCNREHRLLVKEQEESVLAHSEQGGEVLEQVRLFMGISLSSICDNKLVAIVGALGSMLVVSLLAGNFLHTIATTTASMWTAGSLILLGSTAVVIVGAFIVAIAIGEVIESVLACNS